MIKTFNNKEIEGNFLCLIKDLYVEYIRTLNDKKINPSGKKWSKELGHMNTYKHMNYK